MKNNIVASIYSQQAITHPPTEQELRVLWQFAQEHKGWVYIAENVKDPDLLKIGYTQKDPFIRARTLKTAGVVGSFKTLGAYQVVDCFRAEGQVHRMLKHLRADGEFFRVSLSVASAAVLSVWRDERTCFKFFKMDWLLHDQNNLRWLDSGFDTEQWVQSDNNEP